MKLVDRVLDNISAETIETLAQKFELNSSKMSAIINSMIPGVLSAFKARIVSSMNTGDIKPLLDLISDAQTDITIDALFNDNTEALNTVYNRVSEFTAIDIQKISQIVPKTMPIVSVAISQMLQEFGSSSLLTAGNNFMSELITSDNGYEQAINAANKFIGNIFGIDMQKKNTPNKNPAAEDDNFIQNLYDLFDQDNDGSVMDDIYHMLVR